MSDPYWGNSEDPEYNPRRRRKFRDRYRADEDAFGAADAEDFYDDDASYDMTFGEHAAGLDRDLSYERSYSERQGEWDDDSFYDGQTYEHSEQQMGKNMPTTPKEGGLPMRAAQFRQRLGRRQSKHRERYGDPYDKQQQAPGIDSLFEATPSLSWLPCSNSVLLMLVAAIGILSCLVLAFLAAGSLQRLLGV